MLPSFEEKYSNLQWAFVRSASFAFMAIRLALPVSISLFSSSTHAVSLLEKQSSSVEKEKIKTKKENKQLKKEWKKQLRKIAPDKTGEKVWVKILLIVLTVAVAILLLYGLALLACTLSCNGAEAAAWLVGILGLAGIMAGLFFVIRGIVGRKKKKEKQSSTN
jgi:Na+/melibiose symporter-like transporter